MRRLKSTVPNHALQAGAALAAPSTARARSQVKYPPAAEPHTYTRFDQLDGRHPLQQAVPGSYLLYPARKLKNCRIAYFNFELAKEMGLVDSVHPHQLNKQLEQKILDTFAIQIINEYDQLHHRKFPESSIKPYPYMATRYLQLQHANKRGQTSGDGRSVWNGTVTHRGTSWDVSSRGTGVTSLAPGAVEANRPLKSGSEEFGYGCGMADIDELFSSAVMSEILHHSDIQTERMLAIIDVGRNLAIGVRAAPNLVRPAHLFLHLKQNNHKRLKQAVDFLIERQVQNKVWNFSAKSPKKYDLMAQAVCHSFAKFTAVLEREYIFMWLDWDGDNCLADAGIIDYGSIRVFGLRHDQYRYDDVDRYSTNLNEQKKKARLLVQVFIQMADFLKTGKRKPLARFKGHALLREFDETFEQSRRERLLHQMGYNPNQIRLLMTHHLPLVARFETQFEYFERMKTRRQTERLPDGINRPAIFNMRTFLREAPRELSFAAQEPEADTLEAYFHLMFSANMTRRDSKFTRGHRARLQKLLNTYMQIARAVSTAQPLRKTLLQVATQAQKTCREQRMTGNAVENVVAELLKFRRKKMPAADLQMVIEAFIAHQTDRPTPKLWGPPEGALTKASEKAKLFQELLTVVDAFHEDI